MVYCRITCHPERPDIPVNQVAKHIFETAMANQANLTGVANSYLTSKDMGDIFSRFDINGGFRAQVMHRSCCFKTRRRANQVLVVNGLAF